MIVYADNRSGKVPRKKARVKRVVDSIYRPVVPYRVAGLAHYHSMMKGWWEEGNVTKNAHKAMSEDEAAVVWLDSLTTEDNNT